jgi:DNA-binding response OmpR family regulator
MAESPNGTRYKKVLVAECNDHKRFLLTGQLYQWGLAIALASNAAEARHMLRHYGEFDHLILNQASPRINGLDFLASAREANQIPAMTQVLLLGGNKNAEEVSVQARKLGANFLRMPCALAELRSAIS